MNAKKILSAVLSVIMLLSVCTIGISAESNLPFTDVEAGSWYYDAVAYTYGKGLMNGTGDGSTFAPGMNLTRGMVVTVLYRNDGSPAVEISNPFGDVDDGQYYATAAAWAYDEGVVTGTGTDDWGDPLFSPDRNITRQELATMFARYAAYKHVDTSKNTAALDSFPDSGKVASWAADSFKWSNGTGIITGKQNGDAATLSPEDLATRAEFAIMIQRYNTKDDAREFTYFLVYEKPVLKSQYTEPEYAKVENADIYVAVDGLDTNPGTKDKPLATFEAAKAKVREMLPTAKKDIVVAFKAGDYGTLDNVKFTSEDSGNDKVKVTYCAYGDGEVYFTGGVFVEESEFTALSDSEKALFTAKAAANIKKVDLSGSAEADKITGNSLLFSESGFGILARYPNKEGSTDNYIHGSIVQQLPGPGHTHEDLYDGAANGKYTQDQLKEYTDQKRIKALAQFKQRLDSYTSLDGVTICGNISKVWHADNLDVESYDKSTGIITFKQSPHYGFVNFDDNYASIYIAGAAIDLDTAGEYWFDANTKTLYVYEPKGQYLMSNQDTFCTMYKADNIAFKKLNFRGTTDSSFKVNTCNGFTFDQSTLLYCGGIAGIDSDYSINIKVTNSELGYFADTGIYIYAPRNGSYIEGYHPDSLVGDGLVIDNNSIHDIGILTVGVDTAGIYVNRSVKGQITHNEIYNSARCAIRFDDCIELDIAYNYFHHCMLNSGDGGVIYSFRSLVYRDCNVRYNLFTDIPDRTGIQYAIYNDGAHAWNICGNVFYDAGSVNIVLNGGRDNYVYENICIEGERDKVGFLVYNSDMIDEEPSDVLKIGPDEEVNATFDRLSQKPDQNSPYYDLWREKWPLIYDFLLDFEDVDKGPQCIYYTVNYIKDNYLFDMSCSFEEGSIADHFGVFENNKELTTDKNDYFTDPTHGDYSPAKGVSMPNNHFDKIGRY